MYKEDNTEELDPIEAAEDSTVEEYFDYICLTRNDDVVLDEDFELPF